MTQVSKSVSKDSTTVLFIRELVE
ncbi:uncharacterized protein METZ01_LOCUS422685 [marine metagenome]|uniref:Uncharacterized protein n=1 Tax=marine metagenome TaxID=408172 RepID=A0A382XHC1_9ZZZZ